ncbi:MAG TPA: PHP domain-containing protein, partial [Limnochordia bacterium]|nr:PHP domain-containing protein [Limnochordia bacterium]
MPFECWIEPEPAAARLTDLLRRLNWDGELSTALASALVKRIELAGPEQEWRIVIDRPAEAPGALAQALAAHAPALRLVPEQPAPAARPALAAPPILRTSGALAEAPDVQESPAVQKSPAVRPEAPAEPARPAAPPATDEDDPDDYMQAIMQRARDFLERGEAEASAPKSAERLLLGREISGRTTALRDLQEEERSVSICAEVMSCEVTELRSGRRLISCDVTDYTDSLSLKLFEETDGQLGGKIKAGQWIRARGPVQHDRYTQELVLMPNDLMVVPKPAPRLDTAETKRVELHLHTKMSALDGAVDIDRLIAQAAEWGHDAVAITDHGVVQAFPEAYAAAKRAKIKLIYGVEGYLLEGDDLKGRSYHIILLAKDETGLRNLYKLVSDSHIHHFYRRPNIPRALLDAHRSGLIVGSACEAGELYQAILNGAAEERLAEIARYYDYLEIQPIGNNLFLVDEGKADEERLRDINRRIVDLGRAYDRPVIATCDVHYLNPEDEIYRRIIMASHGFADTERTTPVYLRTTDEMLAEFAYLGEETARAVVIDEPRRIAALIKPMAPVPEGNHPPKFEGADEELREMTLREAARLYGDPLPPEVAQRLERELDSIVGNGYATLYLIAQKLVRRSLDDGYLVGSRGSVGSSLVATVCGISEVNPLPPHYLCRSCRHLEWVAPETAECGPDLEPKDCPNCRTPLAREGFDIPFETFLGFHGDKVPDIDLNFSGEYQ